MRSRTHPRASAARGLRGEEGIALVVAVGVLAVLTIAAASALQFASSGARTASRSHADQVAYALAEAGINNAMAVLSLPANDALSAGTLPPPPPSPGARTDTYEGGTVTWGGALGGTTWTLTSIGRVTNPSGAGTVERRLTASVPVLVSLTQPLNSPAWNYLFATNTGRACDTTIKNSVVIRSSVYVIGNLCLDNTATIQKTAVPGESTILAVGGRLELEKTANGVGTAGTPIDAAHVAGGCTWSGNPLHSPCSGADNVWATVIDTTPPPVTPPVPDFDYWYAHARPGPGFPCTVVSGAPPVFENEGVGATRNGSVPGPVDLTPAASYTCQYVWDGQVLGELSWNAATRVLTVKGVLYIDGTVRVDNNQVNTYDGQATLYVTGKFELRGTAELCGAVAGGHCDFAGWNPNSDLLAVVAGDDVEVRNSSRLQAGVYAADKVEVENSAQFDGPMVGGELDLNNSAQIHAFPPLDTVPIALPGNPNVYAQPQPPRNFGG